MDSGRCCKSCQLSAMEPPRSSRFDSIYWWIPILNYCHSIPQSSLLPYSSWSKGTCPNRANSRPLLLVSFTAHGTTKVMVVGTAGSGNEFLSAQPLPPNGPHRKDFAKRARSKNLNVNDARTSPQYRPAQLLTVKSLPLASSQPTDWNKKLGGRRRLWMKTKATSSRAFQSHENSILNILLIWGWYVSYLYIRIRLHLQGLLVSIYSFGGRGMIWDDPAYAHDIITIQPALRVVLYHRIYIFRWGPSDDIFWEGGGLHCFFVLYTFNFWLGADRRAGGKEFIQNWPPQIVFLFFFLYSRFCSRVKVFRPPNLDRPPKKRDRLELYMLFTKVWRRSCSFLLTEVDMHLAWWGCRDFVSPCLFNSLSTSCTIYTQVGSKFIYILMTGLCNGRSSSCCLVCCYCCCCSCSSSL